MFFKIFFSQNPSYKLKYPLNQLRLANTNKQRDRNRFLSKRYSLLSPKLYSLIPKQLGHELHFNDTKNSQKRKKKEVMIEVDIHMNNRATASLATPLQNDRVTHLPNQIRMHFY